MLGSKLSMAYVFSGIEKNFTKTNACLKNIFQTGIGFYRYLVYGML